ncbi:hypothetical protein [Nonomuraea sp. LPB2021202275-12-8]|uniref:hypothetical protein n=1 Tax=Nonomuraea sp. LPB2021202275-12-8 TaxID=3120159 RepID=UPI00300CC842
MSWTLESPEGARLYVNAWNWRPTLTLLETAGVLDAETAALLGLNGHIPLTGQEAARIAEFLGTYLDGLPADGRVRLDGTVTTDPDTHELHRTDLDLNYSASSEWLRAFRDFCRAAPHGFTCS